MADYGIINTYLNSFFAFTSFFLIFILKRKDLFYFGCFVGILWFWWIALALRYYDLLFLAPFFIIFLALVYGLIFYALSYFSKDRIYLKAILLLILPLIHPFSFNWFEPKLVLLQSHFSISDISYFIFILSIAFFADFTLSSSHRLKKLLLSISCLIFLLLYPFKDKQIVKSNINQDFSKFKIINTKISQDERVESTYYIKALNFIFKNIHQAIKEKKEIIIFPETILPTYFNKIGKYEREKLKTLSKKIKIIIGSLYLEKQEKYNSIYYYSNNKEKIFHKQILTPLGEKNPFFKSLNKLINDTFYNGAIDFSEGNTKNIIKINNKKVGLAICYEATSDDNFHKNIDYMIAISNNSWFNDTPKTSIQSTLQNLLLKFYARKYNINIIHSANYGKDEIIYGK